MSFQLSPGVNVQEIDLTTMIPAVATSGGGFVGQFDWGPVEDFTLIDTRDHLLSTFGKPTDYNFKDWFTAASFLAYSSSLNVVRVVDNTTALNAVAQGTPVLVKNAQHYELVGPTIGANVFVSKYPGDMGSSIEIHMADALTYTDWEYAYLFDGKPGTSDFVSDLGSPNANDELHIVVIDAGGRFTGTPNAILERFAFCSKAKNSKSLDGEPNFYGSILNKQSSYVWWVGNPTTGYGQDGAVQTITVTDGGSGYDVAPVVTITGAGTGASATANLALTGGVYDLTITAGGSGYVVGDPVVISGDGTGATAEVGAIDGSGGVTAITITNHGSGYTTATASLVSAGDGLATATVEIGYAVASITVVAGGQNYDTATAVVSVDASLMGTQATASATVSVNLENWNVDAGIGTQYKTLQWVSAPTGLGENDGESLQYRMTGGANGTNPDDQDYVRGWSMFANAEVVDVQLLFLGDCGADANHKIVTQHVIDNVVTVRKDCIVCISPKYADVINQSMSQATENVIATKEAVNRSTSYAVWDSGWKSMYDVFNDKIRWVPLNGDVAGLMAYTDDVADPWYSPAGFNRGRLKNVISLAYDPSKTYRDELYGKNSINPVCSFKNEGVILYGDRTALTKSSAFQKINVRRLFIVLEKAIATAAKYSLFEFNDSFTRAQFVNQVSPFLREVKGRRGLYAFKVVCDETNNTPEVIDRSEFVASIFIKPSMSINFITLKFVAVRTGVEFDEVVGQV